ncbi:MAG: ribonuclease HII [Candidatus Nanopelagicaceae bacterium]
MSPSKSRSSRQRSWIEDSLFEHGLRTIAGVDEAGRGACAGPLVIAAVAIDRERHLSMKESLAKILERWGTLDSKAMKEELRESVFETLHKNVIAVEVVTILSQEIDRHGLQEMNTSGMRRALSQITIPIDYALTDGYAIEGLDMPSLAIWKGDAVSMAVGAASIVAKVTRDRLMIEWDRLHPEYGFARHKGYSAPAHIAAIKEHGILPIHRRSYSNIAAIINA